jgi:uncharacterized membrane protein YphA (DoxX/SURF4 family)
MDLALWVTSGLLAVVFAGSGAAKATMARERLIETGQTGIAPFPMWLVRVVAVCELLGAAGLVLPWWADVAPALTPAAAGGLVVVMVGAAISHASLREPKAVAANQALLLLCCFVAAGRIAQLA